ncbi:MAG: hypothetical protein IT370_36905 [Deltaproteobacteria bacterium]|nr:hypothetical protein [Deltaproteobacteria bacterium]
MSTRFRGWLGFNLAVALVGALMALGGCSPAKRGTIPVDSPIYQAPNDDPSAEEEEEEKANEGTEPEGESKAPVAKPAGGKGSREAAASSKR